MNNELLTRQLFITQSPLIDLTALTDLQQFNNSTVQQFNNSTVQQFNNSTTQQLNTNDTRRSDIRSKSQDR
jgi:hypothetical protein